MLLHVVFSTGCCGCGPKEPVCRVVHCARCEPVCRVVHCALCAQYYTPALGANLGLGRLGSRLGR